MCCTTSVKWSPLLTPFQKHLISLSTHYALIMVKYFWKCVCVPRLKRVNTLRPSDAYMSQEINHHWFRKWLVAWPAPSHYLNQCWDIVKWALGNKLQWNLNWNSYIFIQEYAFENVVRIMAAILSRPQCVKAGTCVQSELWAPLGHIWPGRMNVQGKLAVVERENETQYFSCCGI